MEWTPERGPAKRIAADRAEYVFYELRRRGVEFRPRGKSFVAVVPREDDELAFLHPLSFTGDCLGARWELFEEHSRWWIRVARTKMPLDALIWRLAYNEDE